MPLTRLGGLAGVCENTMIGRKAFSVAAEPALRTLITELISTVLNRL
jgi:hypothetical protein